MIDPGALIDQARRLARWSIDETAATDDDAPHEVDLRRAVSAAYYAAFHSVTAAIACSILGDSIAADGNECAEVARHIAHSALKNVCVYAQHGPGNWPKHSEHLGRLAHSATPDHIKSIGLGIVQLRDARTTADYDHTAVHDRAVVLTQIDQAAELVAAVAAMRDTPAFKAFAIAILVDTPAARNRDRN